MGRQSPDRDNEWITPPWLCELVRKSAGGRIALDPFPAAGSHVDPDRKLRNGLGRTSWAEAARGGLVYVNPPYSRDLLGRALERVLTEAEAGARLVLLVPSSTDVLWFHRAYAQAAQLCFLRGRVRFEGRANFGPLFPSAVFHFNADAAARARFAAAFEPRGIVISLRHRSRTRPNRAHRAPRPPRE